IRNAGRQEQTDRVSCVPAFLISSSMEFMMFAFALSFALAADPVDWQQQESAYLQNIRQVTNDFARAGEAYFSPDGKRIIYQAEEKATGNPFYQIFTQDL